jgi:Sulfotransferase domain
LRDAIPDVRQQRRLSDRPQVDRGTWAEHRMKVADIRRQISRKERDLEGVDREFEAAEEWAKRVEYREKKKVTQQQVFELHKALEAEKERARDRRRGFEQRQRIRERISGLREEIRARKDGGEPPTSEEVQEHRQEILQLRNELRAVKERRMVEDGPATGALPDFIIIGAPKCGTTSLYYLLAEHPYVEPAAAKELHFFSSHFDLGLDWYRRCFPRPRYKDGRRTITGEATPSYLFDPYAPQRVAAAVPEARLIVVLRNPVDRAYSLYQMAMRKGWDSTTSFEEAIGAIQTLGSLPPGGGAPEYGIHNALDENSWYLSGGVYVDQLVRWSQYFSDEQMLVIKSEDFSKRPQATLKAVLEFLDLPEWEPEINELNKKRHEGGYIQEMHPATRRRLEEYFEPHNRRLYAFLGEDLGW